MFKRFTSVLLAVVLLLVASPALADQRVDTVPSFNAPNSGRINLAIAIRIPPAGQQAVALAYGNGRFSGDRLQITVVDAMSNQSMEIIAIGNQVYVRAPGSDRWLVANPQDAAIPVGDPMAPAVPADFTPTITRIDRESPEQVDGVPTTQYQLWIDPARLPAATAEQLTKAGIQALTEDFFIGQTDNMLRKLQSNILGTDPQLGDLKIETPIVFSAINEPQVIEAPRPEMIQAIAAASVHGDTVPGAAALPAWERPAVAWLLKNHR
jgi:hypothetical protein